MVDLHPDIDSTGQIVRGWLDANTPSLDTALGLTQGAHGNIASFKFEVADGQEADVARVVAIGLVEERLGLRPEDFSAWFRAMTDSTELGSHEANVQDYTRTLAGTPTSPRPDTHLYGLVAEHMLRTLLLKVSRGLGLPEQIEGHDWAATDHGGDALAIYHHNGQYHFRLWESKAITGVTVSPTSVVTGARKQLNKHGWEYLARYTVVARRTGGGAPIDDFIVRLPDLWRDADPCAGAGVAIATHSSKPTATCFAGLAGELGLPDTHKQGHLVVAGNYASFAHEVRRLIWKGAGWTAP